MSKFKHPMDRRRGHALMTTTVARSLPKLYSQEKVEDPVARVKFFGGGSAVWYAIEFDGEDLFFGWADLGFGGGELGYFSLSEMQTATKRNGMPAIERDLYFRPRPLSQLVERG